jgi:hypothetical protein
MADFPADKAISSGDKAVLFMQNAVLTAKRRKSHMDRLELRMDWSRIWPYSSSICMDYAPIRMVFGPNRVNRPAIHTNRSGNRAN